MTRSRGRTVDVHAHVVTPACQELVAGLMEPEYDPLSYYSTAETNEYQAQHAAEIALMMTDPAVRIADMDKMGIDVQAISVAPPQFYYWTDVELGRRLARMQNENLASMVHAYPGRFVGLATVPLQDVSSAVAELEYCVRELDFRGAEINTNVFGLDLDEPRYRPFFAKAEELDVVVLVHPNGFSHGARLGKYYMMNVIGNPLETTIALNRIIHGGVLEEYPGLKLCFVHGGGYLPFYSARMDHAYGLRPEGRHHITRLPSEYLKQVYVDSMVFDSVHLEFLIQQMGAAHVVLGTDYPFDMGYYDPLGQLEGVRGLSDEDKELIRSRTASRLLNIED
jgi:aminocarboxymuconate-semialdehyde decarboxylase